MDFRNYNTKYWALIVCDEIDILMLCESHGMLPMSSRQQPVTTSRGWTIMNR